MPCSAAVTLLRAITLKLPRKYPIIAKILLAILQERLYTSHEKQDHSAFGQRTILVTILF